MRCPMVNYHESKNENISTFHNLVSGHAGTSKLQIYPQAARGWVPKTLAYSYIGDAHKIGTCGTVASPQISTLDAYTVYPIILDASFHLGASLNYLNKQGHNTKLDTNTKRMHIMRVPTNFGIYSNIMGIASRIAYWANVADLCQHPNDLVSSSYKLGRCNSTNTIEIVHMVSKPLQRIDIGASSPTVTDSEEQLMYEVHWKAVELSPSFDDNLSTTTPQRWQKISREGRHVWVAGLGKETSMYTCAIVNLAIVQHILREQSVESEQCQLLGTMSRCSLGTPYSMVKDSIILATALSFLRSAAQEQSKIVWQSTFDNAFNASTSVLVPRADAFGMQRMGPLTLQAQLLPTFQASVLHMRGVIPKQTVLITGGLGEIGMLVGLWTDANMVGHICMASRMGHSSREADAVLSSMHYATICRCDVACTEEAFHLTSSKATVVRSVMHAGKLTTFLCPRVIDVSLAVSINIMGDQIYSIVVHRLRGTLTTGHVVGGVLHDATLRNQSPSSIRTVAAPKLHGSILISKVVGLLPTTQCSFFSSTSALLTPLGQANYSSSNAQLDALASCMQEMGMSSKTCILTHMQLMIRKCNCLTLKISSSTFMHACAWIEVSIH